MRKTAISLLLALVFSLFMVGVVYAAMGPHGDYRDTTNKCVCCHDVHEALSSFKLLPQSTVMATCNYCHNGTNGRKVYGNVAPAGSGPGEHIMTTDATSVPGTLIGGAFMNTSLTCSNCHSPHDNNTVAAFLGDTNNLTQTYTAPSGLPAYPTTTFYGYGVETNKLLKKNPYRQPTTTDFQFSYYGGGWCSDCHLNRHSEGPINNHPVNTATVYNNVYYWTGSAWAQTKLGGSNNGYKQSASNSTGYTYYPICQQCHEDTRNVEAAFNVTSVSFVASDNPQYKDFPHQTQLDRFRAETGDDLCLNCHETQGLP